MRYLSCVIICLIISGCQRSETDKCQTEPAKKLWSYTVTSDGETFEKPFILVFGNGGHTVTVKVMYLIRHDGTFIWSGNKIEAGPPYYQGHISKGKMAELRTELAFLDNVNGQYKYIEEFGPPDYGFGQMNILGDPVNACMCLVRKSYCVGEDVFWLVENDEAGKLLKMAENCEFQPMRERALIANDIWTYTTEIIGKYVPETGQEVDLSFELRRVEIEVPEY